MKKILFILPLFCCILASCLKGQKSTYSNDYFAVVDSIIYTDSIDSLTYDSLLRISLKELGVTNTIIHEEAEVEDNSMQVARNLCNIQAVNEFNNRCTNLYLTDIKKKLYEHDKELAPDPSQIVIGNFSIHMTLYAADSYWPLVSNHRNF